MIKFIKQNSIVLIYKNDTLIYALPNNVFIETYENNSKETLIKFSNNFGFTTSFTFNYNNVDQANCNPIINVNDTEELILSLSTNFFNNESGTVNAATEATLQSVLSAIQDGREFEVKLVVDNDDVTWLEVRIWNSTTSTFDTPEYYTAGSNTPGIPVTPIQYINPNNLLTQISSNTTGLSTEVTLELVRLLLVALESKDFATQTTLSTVDTKLASLARTPNIIRSSAAGSIAETCYSFSVANVGVDDGVILGVAILPGETLSFDAGALNNFYTAGSVTYDGTGTELVIVYNS